MNSPILFKHRSFLFLFLLGVSFFVLALWLTPQVFAQTRKTARPIIATKSADIATQSSTLDSTASATATADASLASPSAAIIEKIQQTKDQDITQTTPTQQDKLATYLDQNPIGPLNWNNFLEHGIRHAVKNGVPANTLVLVLLFPMIASIIAASRHVIGLRGFGIYIPAVLSVALVSTGLIAGTIIFLAVVAIAIFSKRFLRMLRLSYLPRTALLLWMISMGILFVLLVAPYIGLTQLMSINIFPILILVLLSENFLDAQASTKPADAFWLAIETIGLAFVSGFALRWEVIQKAALLQPELLIVFTVIFNILVGKFVGLRLTEWLRFRPIIEE